jgi:molybdate/tungstate transport system substrate-binding protein
MTGAVTNDLARGFGVLGVCMATLAAGGTREAPASAIEGELVIFHAGSLAVPFRDITAAFMRRHPGVVIRSEVAGSRTCARKISDLGKPCDVLASADYSVIDTLLIPEHAGWHIVFAGNAMTIAYRPDSRGAATLTSTNWFDVLLDPAVTYGRSDPNADPCGYRSVQVALLAERHYGRPGLARQLLTKDRAYIRPKETDLLALLEVGELDYMFIYQSVAEQHGLQYLDLPDAVNLGSAGHAASYHTAAIDVSGRKPGTTLTKRGAVIEYAVTIPRGAPNPALAVQFVEFLLDAAQGGAIMQRHGHTTRGPSSSTPERVPPRLRRLLKE